MKLSVLVLLIFAYLNPANPANLTIKTHFINAGITPAIINGLDIPNQLVRLDYNGKKVELGTEFTPREVRDEPRVYWNTKPGALYTLVMFDPDAPSRADPKLGQVKHWIVGNIPGTDISNGDHITEYLGARPPRKTQFHRYIFVLYEQPGELDFYEEPRTMGSSRSHRFHFNLKRFETIHNLGSPVAVNFFLARWDDFVDQQNEIDMRRIKEGKMRT